MFRHGVALVGFEAVARAIQRQCAHQAVARHLGDDRGGRDRHDNAVAADHRIAVAGHVDLVAAVDEHMLRHLGQRTDRARQRPERGAQDIVAIDPRRRGKGDRKGRLSRRSPRTIPRGARPSAAWNRRSPWGFASGSSTTAAATTGPASGPRPASSQPATGQTPRLISARSRRKLGGATAITPFSGLACSLPAFLSIFLADLSRIMAGIVRKRAPGRNREPGTIPVIQRAAARHSAASIRQVNPPVVADFDAGRDHDFPGMVVGIAEIAGVTAVIGLVRGLQ